MKIPRLVSLLAAAALVAASAGPLRAARAADTSSLKFSDSSKPGRLKIVLPRGDLRITAKDTDEVSVTTEAKPVGRSAPRKDGLRVLSAASSYTLTEKDNVITLDAMSDGWAGGGADFTIVTPRNTSLVIQNAWGGDIRCDGVEGDIEINSLNGEVDLREVAGGVVVSTMNGEITASIRQLRENKPLSFTSMNGEVSLSVPPDAKANVRLRTQNGVVLTDFDENVLVTKTESMSRGRHGSRFGPLPKEARDGIRAAARVGVQIGREVAAAVREGLGEASDEADREFDRAERDLEQAERDREEAMERAERDLEKAEREREQAEDDGVVVHVAPVPPIPPIPPIPTITGGKLVTGTLNGGGPEISVSTMNGDVTLRQLK